MSRCAGIIHTSALRPQLFASPSLPNAAALFTLHSQEGVVTARTGGDESEIEADTSYVSTNLSGQAPGAQPTLCGAFTCVQGQPQASSSKPHPASLGSPPQPTLGTGLAASSKPLPAIAMGDHALFSPKRSGGTFLAYGSENLWDARGDAGREHLPCCREPGETSDSVTPDESKSCGLHGHEPKASQRNTQAHRRDILTEDVLKADTTQPPRQVKGCGLAPPLATWA